MINVLNRQLQGYYQSITKIYRLTESENKAQNTSSY